MTGTSQKGRNGIFHVLVTFGMDISRVLRETIASKADTAKAHGVLLVAIRNPCCRDGLCQKLRIFCAFCTAWILYFYPRTVDYHCDKNRVLWHLAAD